jgi:hypothetical protein
MFVNWNEEKSRKLSVGGMKKKKKHHVKAHYNGQKLLSQILLFETICI